MVILPNREAAHKAKSRSFGLHVLGVVAVRVHLSAMDGKLVALDNIVERLIRTEAPPIKLEHTRPIWQKDQHFILRIVGVKSQSTPTSDELGHDDTCMTIARYINS